MPPQVWHDDGLQVKGIDPKLVILQKAIKRRLARRCGGHGDNFAATGSATRTTLLRSSTAQYEEKHFKTLGQDLYSLAARHRHGCEEAEVLDVDAARPRRVCGAGQDAAHRHQHAGLGDASTTDF